MTALEPILMGLITELANRLGPWVLELSVEAAKALIMWALPWTPWIL